MPRDLPDSRDLREVDLKVLAMGRGDFRARFQAAVVAVDEGEFDPGDFLVVALLARRVREHGQHARGDERTLLTALLEDEGVLTLVAADREILVLVRELVPALSGEVARRLSHEAQRLSHSRRSDEAYANIAARHGLDAGRVMHDLRRQSAIDAVAPPTGLPRSRRGRQRREARLSAAVGVGQPAGKGRRTGAAGQAAQARRAMLLDEFAQLGPETKERFVFDERAGSAFRAEFAKRHGKSVRTINRDWLEILPAAVELAGGELTPLARAIERDDSAAVEHERERLRRLRARLDQTSA